MIFFIFRLIVFAFVLYAECLVIFDKKLTIEIMEIVGNIDER